MHHLIGDHTTLEVMQQEIQAHLLGQEASLPVPMPFRNLVSQARHGISAQENESFFRQMLGDVAEPTAPFGLLDVRGDGRELRKPASILTAIWPAVSVPTPGISVSARPACAMWPGRECWPCYQVAKMLFLALFCRTMQGGEGADRVMGMFINTLPVRIRTRTQTVVAGIRSTHALLADLLRHEHASLATAAQRCSAVPAPAPLFTALLNYRHSSLVPREAEAKQAWEGIRLLRGEERAISVHSLSLVEDLGRQIGPDGVGAVSHGPMRLCEYMRTGLVSLTDALESAPNTRLCNLSVLPDAERRQLLNEWNPEGEEQSKNECLPSSFRSTGRPAG